MSYSEPGNTIIEREPDPSVEEIRARLGQVDERHLALFYDSHELQLRTVAAFAATGLHNNHRVLYIVDENERDHVTGAFTACGIDTEARVTAGDLTIRPASDVYLEERFDPEYVLDRLKTACRDAMDAGYEGFTVIGENTWCFRCEESFEKMVEFESRFDAAAPDFPVRAMCQYNLSRFEEQSIADALRTHERFVYRGEVCANPYYVPPERCAHEERTDRNVSLMLERTHALSNAIRENERRGQRLSVLNRTLRHNIRNTLTTLNGRLEVALRDDDLDPESRDALETARRTATELEDLAEKARYVQETIRETELVAHDLEPVLGEAIAAVERDYPDADISATATAETTVIADERLAKAIEELLRFGLSSPGLDGHATVEVDVTEVSGKRVQLLFGGPNVELSEPTRAALRRGYETKLSHARDLDVWLARWIVDNSGGDLFLADETEGHIVGIELLKGT